MDSVKQTTSNATRSLAEFSISDLRPSQVAVVEAREKDLKEMPLGDERALAFDRKRKRTFWSFSSVNFKEPTLPEVESIDIDGSLLPPKS